MPREFDGVSVTRIVFYSGDSVQRNLFDGDVVLALADTESKPDDQISRVQVEPEGMQPIPGLYDTPA